MDPIQQTVSPSLSVLVACEVLPNCGFFTLQCEAMLCCFSSHRFLSESMLLESPAVPRSTVRGRADLEFTPAPRSNRVRFTPAQVEAIMSGTQPGLTVIVGPPGTGKTDVATQIINNIYHDFPSQRSLLIAHSNQALNQLFQKITKLDIDERHLLRLGHGEEDLGKLVILKHLLLRSNR